MAQPPVFAQCTRFNLLALPIEVGSGFAAGRGIRFNDLLYIRSIPFRKYRLGNRSLDQAEAEHRSSKMGELSARTRGA